MTNWKTFVDIIQFKIWNTLTVTVVSACARVFGLPTPSNENAARGRRPFVCVFVSALHYHVYMYSVYVYILHYPHFLTHIYA